MQGNRPLWYVARLGAQSSYHPLTPRISALSHGLLPGYKAAAPSGLELVMGGFGGYPLTCEAAIPCLSWYMRVEQGN